MPRSILHSHFSRPRRFPLGAVLAVAPWLVTPANAQVGKTATDLSTQTVGKGTTSPQLTTEVRPTSSISTVHRASPNRSVHLRPLVASMPDDTAKGAAVVPPVASATVASATVPSISPPAIAEPLKVASSGFSNPIDRRVAAVTPVRTALSQPKKIDVRPAPANATRMAASLPARGGLAFSNASAAGALPLEKEEPKAVPFNESDRVLLAQLDADLAKAQKRLDRAETRLSEGQRQLGSFTNVLQSAILEAGDDARGLHPFVRVAQRYLGTPYVWGGESARGFDCSGFIMRVMRDLGYKALPHSAAEQFNYGTPVAKGLLRPGDVVFFANTYKPGISHVGIYLGKGRFIHAANSQVGTIVSHLNEPKWTEKYAGARRLVRVRS